MNYLLLAFSVVNFIVFGAMMGLLFDMLAHTISRPGIVFYTFSIGSLSAAFISLYYAVCV